MSSTAAAIPWNEPNRAAWLGQVQAWLQWQIERQGWQLAAALQVVRDRPWAIVLRVPCTGGTLFFKAAGPQAGHELVILETLGRHWNDRLPTVLAREPQRGWLLLQDHGLTLREHLAGADSTPTWLHLLPKFAQMQRADHAWSSLAIPDRRPQVLPAQLRALLQDTAVLRLGQAEGLTQERHAELHRLLPEFEASCQALSAQAATINHGDLHDRNVLVQGGHHRFIDFGDACVSHPLCVLLMPCQKTVPKWFSQQGKQHVRQLSDAYLDAWRDHDDAAALRPLLGRALWVAHVARALAWEEMGRAARGKLRRECQGQVSSWLNIFARRRVLAQPGAL